MNGGSNPISVGWAVSPKAADTLHDVGLRSRRLLRNPVPDVDAPLSMTVLRLVFLNDMNLLSLSVTVSKLRLFFSASALAFARRVADTESLDGDLAGGVRIRYGSGVARSAIGGCKISCVDC